MNRRRFFSTLTTAFAAGAAAPALAQQPAAAPARPPTATEDVTGKLQVPTKRSQLGL